MSNEPVVTPAVLATVLREVVRRAGFEPKFTQHLLDMLNGEPIPAPKPRRWIVREVMPHEARTTGSVIQPDRDAFEVDVLREVKPLTREEAFYLLNFEAQYHGKDALLIAFITRLQLLGIEVEDKP